MPKSAVQSVTADTVIDTAIDATVVGDATTANTVAAGAGVVADAGAAGAGVAAAGAAGAGVAAAGAGVVADAGAAGAGVAAAGAAASAVLATTAAATILLDTTTVASFAVQVIECAAKVGVTIGTAESCTGGMIAAALTAVPGSSEVFLGSVVSYANEIKTALLGVDTDTLSVRGAVSKEVALQMAAGAREILGADFTVSSTGIAGPGGATSTKPVGTVWIGLASKSGSSAQLHCFLGTRNEVREAATKVALQNLKECIKAACR